ncbi:hypothetical protein LRM41_03495 [Candidatus Nanosynbacter sp. TM7-087]|jgi:hypothetical protein|uniref:SDH family Clp fold serine proteinase n=1 Tax=Candidatus Nanosynbacter sp. TM7-087 TaxID=2902631 RepID=UPI001FB8556A|nr:hypothetical protein [Candidatus Nanosynbacter sp. TM7-087]MCJ1966615.1 hypothetical protein [Candidatus Nanosynbacter sp. TM7-087]
MKKSNTIANNKSKNSKGTVSDQFKNSLLKFIESSEGFVYPLIIPPVQSIDEDALFEVYSDLRKIGEQDNLNVLLYSYGGDARTAFHIGRLLQAYSNKKLQIYPLREAKSAATLIASAADNMVMSELSELGPMDPQIKLPSIERRFSPLAIKHSLELLHGEISNGHDLIVKTLAEKLPDPLSLGEALKSLETGKDYLRKLLVSRMFAGDSEKAAAVAEQLVLGYPDHGYCIDFKEAQDIGLVVKEVPDNQRDALYDLMYGYKKIWDVFEFAMSRKDDNENSVSEAMRPLIDLKQVVHEVIDIQKSKESTSKEK